MIRLPNIQIGKIGRHFARQEANIHANLQNCIALH
jgi:hypothetical protein